MLPRRWLSQSRTRTDRPSPASGRRADRLDRSPPPLARCRIPRLVAPSRIFNRAPSSPRRRFASAVIASPRRTRWSWRASTSDPAVDTLNSIETSSIANRRASMTTIPSSWVPFLTPSDRRPGSHNLQAPRLTLRASPRQARRWHHVGRNYPACQCLRSRREGVRIGVDRCWHGCNLSDRRSRPMLFIVVIRQSGGYSIARSRGMAANGSSATGPWAWGCVDA